VRQHRYNPSRGVREALPIRRREFQAAAFREQFQSLTVVQIIKKLAVGADAGESKAIDELPFPQPAQVAMRNVLITTHKSNELGGRRKPVSQNRCENV